MSTVTTKYQDNYLIQNDLTNNGFHTEPDQGAVFKTNNDEYNYLTGEFTNTHHPLESLNPAWKSINIKYTRSTPDSTRPITTTHLLQGIQTNGAVENIGQIVTSDAPGGEQTSIINFNLADSAGEAPLNQSTTTTTAGKARLNLPLTWSDYETCTLNRVWLTDWTRRKVAVVTGLATDSENATFDVTVLYDADMQADFDDIRFCGHDGRTLLNYSLNSKTDSTTASFKVQYPYLPKTPGTRNLYMYYGNASATSLSDSSLTSYLINDDFTSFDSETWTGLSGGGTTALSITGGELEIINDGSNRVYFKTQSSYNGVQTIEYSAKKSENWEVAFCWDGNLYGSYDIPLNGYYLKYNSWDATKKIQLMKVTSGSETSIGSYNITLDGNYHTYKIEIDGTRVKIYYDTTLIINAFDYKYRSGYIGLSARETPAAINAYYDWFKLSNPTGSTPSVGAWSSEQATTYNQTSPDTVTDNSQQWVEYTLPGDWTAGTPSYFLVKELNSSDYESPDAMISSTDVLSLGYDHVARYQALRIRTSVSVPYGAVVSFSEIEYKYEV